jgi:hypothetical protein
LPIIDPPGPAQPAHHDGILVSGPALVFGQSPRRRQISRVERLLDADRNASERTHRRPRCEQPIDERRLLSRAIRTRDDDRVQSRIRGGQTLQNGIDQLT